MFLNLIKHALTFQILCWVWLYRCTWNECETCNIRRSLVGNKIVNQSHAVAAWRVATTINRAWFCSLLNRSAHWNENVFILMKSSSLAAPKVVKMTTFGAASDETFIKMMTFSFQCKTRRKTLQCYDFKRLILHVWQTTIHVFSATHPIPSVLMVWRLNKRLFTGFPFY